MESRVPGGPFHEAEGEVDGSCPKQPALAINPQHKRPISVVGHLGYTNKAQATYEDRTISNEQLVWES